MTEIILGLYLIGFAWVHGYLWAGSWSVEIMTTIPHWKMVLFDLIVALIWPIVAVVILWAFWVRREY